MAGAACHIDDPPAAILPELHERFIPEVSRRDEIYLELLPAGGQTVGGIGIDRGADVGIVDAAWMRPAAASASRHNARRRRTGEIGLSDQSVSVDLAEQGFRSLPVATIMDVALGPLRATE